MSVEKEIQNAAGILTEIAADDGCLIEIGWKSLRAAAIPDDAPQVQLECMREAFYAGAQHLFSSIVHMLSASGEPTPRDMRRMENVSRELSAFIKQFEAKHRIRRDIH